MQLRDPSSLTSEAYVAQRAWQDASLASCPRHPQGGCGFARHGTYPRQTPAGMRIARYYCPTAHETFSLLPDVFTGDARLGAVRAALGTDHALVTLRARAVWHLAALPRPLGFGPHVSARSQPRPRVQHDLGADPGPSSG